MEPPNPQHAPRPRRRRTLTAGAAVVAAVLVCVLVADGLWRSVGPLVPPPSGAEPGRWVFLEGAANTRDLGGYPATAGRAVKRRMVFRSATLAGLSARGADAFRGLGVKTIIDFRNRLTPWPPFRGDPWSVQMVATVHGCPMTFAKCDTPADFYVRGVQDNADSYRAAFELLGRAESYPVLYHCTAGTDRTGVMTALLLALLGVARDTVVADFRLSEQVDLPGSLVAMNALLDHVAARGGIGAYLAELGVPAETQERIRALLLEPR